MDKRAKELLNWATSQSAATPQSSQTDPPVRPSKTLDPSIIDAILGPDDSTLMVDSMRAITDTSLDLDDRSLSLSPAAYHTVALSSLYSLWIVTKTYLRLTAFDNLELLVEQIDNASNLDILKLWPPLLATLSSPEPQLRRYAAWVIGTAVQNNPKAQGHLFQYQGNPP
jgi:hsp70-interacting protein